MIFYLDSDPPPSQPFLSNSHSFLPPLWISQPCLYPSGPFRPPPPHLSNGGIVLMDCPKQQRGRRSCHSTFTPPLHSTPVLSILLSAAEVETCTLCFFYFPLSCRPGNPLRFEEKLFHLDWPSSRGSCYSVTPNKQQSSHFGQQEQILGVEDSDFTLALNPRDRLFSGFKKSAWREWGKECKSH